ncbi:MAG: SP_1767 family glycosyltransferase [Clostridia bacterium]|nr:SP_1767 family glycosyltransferase [Clostridia bacterium]
MNKVSIIVPVYNVERYLVDSIESAVNQTYKNIEIILIDDGSKDSSGIICDDYAKKDNRIKVIHQENAGLSGARNTGLSEATGDYIMFLDSDDTFELDACEKLVEYIDETNADYVIGNYANMSEDGKVWDKPIFDKSKYHKFKLSITDYDQSFYIMNSGVWNKIFRKSFLDELGILFEDRLPAEDAIFTTYCFIKSKNVYYLPEIVYDYRLRDADSISTSCSIEYFMGINKAYRIIYNNFKNNNHLDYYRYFYAKSVNYMLFRFIDSEKLVDEERIKVLDAMKWFYTLGSSLRIPTVIKSVKYILESIENRDYEQTLKYCEILRQIRKMLPKEINEKMSKPNAETYKEIEEYDMDNEMLKRKADLLQEMQKSPITIMNIEDTINKIKTERKSIARFGDGELDIIKGGEIGFQNKNEKLGQRLKEVLSAKQDFCIIGVPDVLNSFDNLTEESEKFWINNMEMHRKTWLEYLHNDMEYGTSNMTRLYIRYKDRSNAGKYFDMLKSLWEDRDVVICEGEQTRMGVGNDLLDKCKSVKRVICPSENAFDKYDEIIAELRKQPKDSLIVMALGPTATILAYELAREGYQALDIGHLDIEYEWYIRNVSKKEKIMNKYTNEVKQGNITQDVKDEDYNKQIETVIE